MSWELPDIHAGFRKGRGTKDQIANILWIIEEEKEFQEKTSTSSMTKLKPLMCGSQPIVKNSLRDDKTKPPYLPPEKPIYISRSNS